MKRLINKARAFFYIYSRSITSPEYYKEILATRQNFTIKYYALLAVAVSIFTTAVLTVRLVPALNRAVDDISSSAKEAYPEDFILTVENNKWSINQTEPYKIPIPNELYSNIRKDPDVKFPRNIVVFDHNGTIDDVYKNDSFALINEKYVLTLDDNGAVNSTPLQNLPNGRLDKRVFENFVDQASGIKKYLPYLVGGGVLIFSIVLNVFLRIPGLMLVALIVWAVARLMKLGLGYKESLRITAHTATLPFTVAVVAQIFNYQIQFLGWFSLMTLGYAVVVLAHLRRNEDRGGAASGASGETATGGTQ